MEDHLMHKQCATLNWEITNHAQLRMSQRNLTANEIEFVTTHGTLHMAADAVFFYLRRKDIPKEMRRQSVYSRLVGTTVVVGQDLVEVITVYRNRKSGMHRLNLKS
jgi:hypothetical protein